MSFQEHSNDGAISDEQQAESDRNFQVDEITKIARELPVGTLTIVRQLLKILHNDTKIDVLPQNENGLAEAALGT